MVAASLAALPAWSNKAVVTASSDHLRTAAQQTPLNWQAHCSKAPNEPGGLALASMACCGVRSWDMTAVGVQLARLSKLGTRKKDDACALGRPEAARSRECHLICIRQWQIPCQLSPLLCSSVSKAACASMYACAAS